MKQVVRMVSSLVVGLSLAACSDKQSTTYPTRDLRASADRAGAMVGFGFNGTVTGFGPGIVNLTGGGSYDPATAINTLSDETIAHSGGGFSCLNTVDKLNLNGCETGQGVRWDTEQLLASTGFKCTGAATEAGKTAFTNEHTVVLQSDFYRAGDANDASFHAKIIVADHDLDDVAEGIQNVWIQGVGCGTGNVNFSQQGRPFVN
jgi:hypothetical protein